MTRPGAPRRRSDPARRAAHAALCAFARDAAVRIDERLARTELDARDRAFAREIASGVVRSAGWLDHVMAPLASRGLPADVEVLSALRIGAYQMLSTRVPAHAAVDESVELVRTSARGFVNAVLRRLDRMIERRAADASRSDREVALADDRCLVLERELPAILDQPGAHIAIRYGLPQFLVESWIATFGVEAAHRAAAASLVPPAIHLRAVVCNVGDRSELARRLALDGVETMPAEHPAMLRWTGGASPLASREFEQGGFVVQDPTALRAVEALAPRPGEAVLDLCAAPGTKATWLAEAVGSAGIVYAYDIDPARRARIADNARRLRLPQLTVVDDLARIDRPIDRVLVDVPCSNTGVLSRRVEARHRLRASDFAGFATAQRRLLDTAFGRLREDAGPGPRVVYSTCSIEPAENEAVTIEAAARVGAEVLLVSTALPDPPHHDGGFHAVLAAPGRSPTACAPGREA